MRVTSLVAAFAALAVPAAARAAIVEVTVTFQNLAPANSVSFAPLRFGFNGGTFDAFDEGTTPTAPIISIAEGGSGSDWFPAFAAADPSAVLGSASAAPVQPGQTVTSQTFRVDTRVNPFFTFGAMVVPSNDFFIGNDDPREYRLFDNAGNLLINTIDQTASDVWDNGSELFDPLAAAFLAIGTNALRTPQNGTTQFDFTEFARFNGLLTAGGYIFDSQLVSGLPIGQIRFASRVVDAPEPAAVALLGLGLTALTALRRRRLG